MPAIKSRWLLWCGALLLLAGCAVGPSFSPQKRTFSRRTPSPYRKTSRPYRIKGLRYFPQQYYELDQVGIASYYGEGDKCHGQLTASGERFNAYRMTAAHKTLPLPCMVKVTNLKNGRSVILRVNDRGPFKKARILDVSVTAAKRLGFYKQGLARVRVQTLVPESLRLKENRTAGKKAKCTPAKRRGPGRHVSKKSAYKKPRTLSDLIVY